MAKALRLHFLCIVFSILASVAALSAQQSKGLTSAPVLPQINAAQKVFISNAGGESLETVMDETVFNGGPDRPYNQFYAAMKSWGRYEPVPSPARTPTWFWKLVGFSRIRG
jgi:hypothetical protein